MNVSLDQAIEIHARVLKFTYGNRAPALARKRAQECSAAGDHEGYSVWQSVAKSAESLLAPAINRVDQPWSREA